MKRFNDLSEAELTAITEDDVQRYIDYACADAGVPLLPSLPPEPVPMAFEPDTKLFSVSYHLNFPTAEGAARVMDAIRENGAVETDYLQTPSRVTSSVISRRRHEPTLNVTEAFSPELAARLKDDLAGAKQAEEIYAKAKKEYDSAVAQREAYAADIRSAVEAAWETRYRRENRQRDYERYLDLAEGNREIALRFLTRAHSDTKALLPELFVTQAEAEPAR